MVIPSAAAAMAVSGGRGQGCTGQTQDRDTGYKIGFHGCVHGFLSFLTALVKARVGGLNGATIGLLPTCGPKKEGGIRAAGNTDQD
jgi:hypothetical protein